MLPKHFTHTTQEEVLFLGGNKPRAVKSLIQVTPYTGEARRPSLFGPKVPALNPGVLLCFNSSKKNISYNALTASCLHFTEVALGWPFMYRISFLGSQKFRMPVKGPPRSSQTFWTPEIGGLGLGKKIT